jgi:hypothetical protein
MNKLENRLREIEEEIFRSKSLTDKLSKKITSHPLVHGFDELEFMRMGTYHLYFKPLASWIKDLKIEVGSYATPGWDGKFKDGIFLEPELIGDSKEFHKYFPGDGSSGFPDDVRSGSNYLNIREYLGYFQPEKTKKMYDELFVLPVREKTLESIKNVDDYIDWYYGQIDRVIETLKKSLKLVKEVAIETWYIKYYARGGKVWDKLNKQAIENHGEFGFATLDYDDMGKYINMKKANKLADKEFAEFGFDTLSESEMEELVNKYPEILKKYSRGYEEGEVDGNYDGGYDVVVYNRDGSQGVLEGGLSYSEAMKLLKSVKQYRNQYQEIAIIVTNSRNFEGNPIRYMKYFQKGGELMDADTEFEYARGGKTGLKIVAVDRDPRIPMEDIEKMYNLKIIKSSDADSPEYDYDVLVGKEQDIKGFFEDYNIGDHMYDEIEDYAKGGKLMDADTEFEYNRGGDVNDDLDQLEEASDMVNTAANLVEDVVPPSLMSNYRAYGRYGFDQLLGKGNPYDKGLDEIGQAIEESYNYEEGEEYAKGGDIDRDYKMINVGRSSVFTSGFKIYPEALKVGKIYEWTTGAQPLYVRYLGLTKDLNIRSSSSVGSDKYKFQFVGPGETNRYIGLSGTAVRQGNVVQVKNIEELIKEETLSEIKDYEKFIRKAKRAKDNNQIDRLTKKLNEYKSFYKSIDKLNQYAKGGKVGDKVEIELTNGTTIKGKIERLNPLKLRTDATSTQVIPNALIKKIKVDYAKGGDIKDKKFTFNKVEDKERFYEGGNISQVSKVGDPDYPTYEL